MSNLVIVESPAKAKTIQKYLGDNYEVVASMGHIRDLPKSKIGLDLKDGNRVTFNEITKTGVQNGMAHPRQIDQALVDAQQARRILDRIVGYKISPFLWRKIRRGLSAGRVQSVAVKLIVDREEEIRAFKSEEYWTIDASLLAEGSRKAFPAKYHGHGGKKQEIKDKETADAILAALQGVEFQVGTVKKGVRKKSPAPPFITSTLQQEASRKLGFQARRTMKAAQELYEGVEVEGMGAMGLITYMRTDSLRLSDEAVKDAAAFIEEKYGKPYLPQTKRVYKSKASAQDGHEAIRPTVASLTPDKVKGSLTSDQYKLYKLIWERFIASQMATALLDTVSADIHAGDYLFKASGYSVKFDGFTVLYVEGKDEEEEDSGALPPLETGMALKVKALDGNQHFTQPPARFTEASLIKTLEENGIGRPSTYAPTITTILQRNYVERDAKALKPTPLGEVTTKLMEDQFSNIVDVDFTANMEKNLDGVEEGKTDWVSTLDNFYKDFAATLEQAEKNMDGTRIKVPDEETDVVCELCGRKMVIKMGRFGKFLACPGFPECKNTKKIVQETGGICPLCGGKVLAKKSKNGKGYYGCENNPTCSFMTWDKPLTDLCPQCGSTLFKKAGRYGRIHCLKPDCGYEQATGKEKKEKEE